MILLAYFKNDRQYFTTYSLIQVSLDVEPFGSIELNAVNQNQSILVTGYENTF